jgi:catechol 1,2-dioxygenase
MGDFRDLGRRSFLELAGAGTLSWVFGCRRSEKPVTPVDASSGAACAATAPNIEGPYYRQGAPFRRRLVGAGMAGTPLTLSGRVLSLDCRSALSGAMLDVWQADASGHYDNDGSSKDPGMRLRGRLRCNARGEFRVETIIPGRYLNGRQYRPAHIHVKLAAAGHQPLTTQLYFPGDPFNDVDPFIDKSLIVDMTRRSDRAESHYDFVLTPRPARR